MILYDLAYGLSEITAMPLGEEGGIGHTLLKIVT